MRLLLALLTIWQWGRRGEEEKMRESRQEDQLSSYIFFIRNIRE